MLKEYLQKNNISVYKLSKKSDVLIRQKSFYIVFCQSGKKYTREVMPVKHESTLYIDILAQWKLDEELSKLELEAAYESLHF